MQTVQSEDRLPEIWQQCDLCHMVDWVDPYSGCCAKCSAPIKDNDNVTNVVAGIVPKGYVVEG